MEVIKLKSDHRKNGKKMFKSTAKENSSACRKRAEFFFFFNKEKQQLGFFVTLACIFCFPPKKWVGKFVLHSLEYKGSYFHPWMKH